MKKVQALKGVLATLVSIGIFLGLYWSFKSYSQSQPTGYYTPQDTLSAYNKGYKTGAENMREACKRYYTDTTVKTCHELGLR